MPDRRYYFTGSIIDPGYFRKRSWLERSGADHWCNRHLLGMYLFPTLKHHRSIVNFIFVFPLLFTFVVTVIIPLCLGVFYSLTDWNGIKMTGFVGFTNYKAMFNEPSFLWSLIITILFVVLNMVLVNVVAFMLALLCTSKVKGLSFFRASYFLPNLIGGIVLGYVWQFIFNNVLIKMTNNISLLSKTNTAMMLSSLFIFCSMQVISC